MIKSTNPANGIPLASDLIAITESENTPAGIAPDKRRLLRISILSILLGLCVSLIAKFLVYLINFFTNLSFLGRISIHDASPSDNALGIFVIIIPVLGGVVVGLMAYYGSKAIRGHGIPEAMEQILTNQSKIHPSIIYLKPLSAAISIGTGGPFGAEGPIISTGGAIGSTLGQMLRISDYERKILLAAGATAGMAAIFGTPLSAIFLAIELLLFEFSPRSIIPVALACITGAAGHHLLFGTGPVFSMATVESPGNGALALYSFEGVLIGVLSAGVTWIVYFIEDHFEKLPIHWMWWPAVGGLIVGVIGYFAPHTMGVGYENITALLSGNMSFKIIVTLCFLKFISWAIALGSGTSGGTLAPLLTIGGAAGTLIGIGLILLFPNAGISLPLAALVGMSAMFAGASRALLTSIIFAIEATGQSHAILPLLSACMASYFISYFLMENTIMTEKIARRGIKTPHTYQPDILEKINVEEVIGENNLTICCDNSIKEVKLWLDEHRQSLAGYFIVVDVEGCYKGIVSFIELYDKYLDVETPVNNIIGKNNITITMNQSLRVAVDIMARESIDVLPVLSSDNTRMVVGVLCYKDILAAYRHVDSEHERGYPNISIKRKGIRILLKGQKLITRWKAKV